MGPKYTGIGGTISWTMTRGIVRRRIIFRKELLCCEQPRVLTVAPSVTMMMENTGGGTTRMITLSRRFP